MRITALALKASPRWPGLRTESLAPGLNVFHGPTGSGKTVLADLISHALFGKRLLETLPNTADGELIVEGLGRGYRLRRLFDAAAQSRLTIAALDGSAVERGKVRQFLGGLTPALAAPVFLPCLRDGSVELLLSEDCLRQLLCVGETNGQHATVSLKAELVDRRDALARELEMHIAGQRIESRTLDERWRQLDSLVREAELNVGDRRERLRAVDADLTEVETRLRYLELEATLGQQSPDSESADWELQVIELDERIAQWRVMMSKLGQREAEVRNRLAQVRPDDESSAVTLADQRAWLAVARRWTADLQGEVARLARATESQSCVCRDAHPRLQPIVETIVGQLNTLGSIVEQQQLAAHAAELSEEADDLARSQAELQRQVEHLLERRQTALRGTKLSRRPLAANKASGKHDDRWRDLQQLDQRRWQLQKEHAELVDELAVLEPRLRNLRSERDSVDRQRAGLLSAQSIDALRGQLAAVQRQLECASHTSQEHGTAAWDLVLSEASDFLAQLTDGGLVGIQLSHQGLVPQVVNRAGQSVALTSLTAVERRQIHVSASLAMASFCGRRGVRMPLVLDEPFAGLDAARAAALAAVLDELGRRGQQVFVFTGDPTAIERFTSLGVAAWSMRHLQRVAEADETLIDRPAAGRVSKALTPANGQKPRQSRSGAAAANGRRRKPKRKRTGQ